MNIMLIGAAGFIGTNLVIKLAEEDENILTLVDKNEKYFDSIKKIGLNNARIVLSDFNMNTDFDNLLKGQDIVYHLVSTTVPTTSNQQIPDELMANVIVTSKMLEACVRCKIKKVIFISSGGTVYGKERSCPLNEETATYPISSYGIQKITIEKLLYLYQYLYGLDYRVIRLANPYGPYQRPDGVLGVVTTFIYKALNGEPITIYGDGSVIRDFIYIEDAVRGILNIVKGDSAYKTFNLGSGYGTSVKEVLNIVKKVLEVDVDVKYTPSRKVDVPVNFLDISRYEKEFGKLYPVELSYGVLKTAEFMKKIYNI